VPSSSVDDPLFNPDAEWKGKRHNCPWNGRVWPMTNSHIIDALARVVRLHQGTWAGKLGHLIRQFARMMTFDGDPERPNSFEHYHPHTGRLSGMACVTLRGLTKTFDGGASVALQELSLEVRDGEFLVLLGPSGCGKTTALRCIAGLEEPTLGEVLIGEREVTHLPPADRDVAMVFQNYALYPHLTARGNIAFGLEVRGVAEPEIARRVQEVAQRLGLTELLDRRPAQLSGGQRQRVALGRAIV